MKIVLFDSKINDAQKDFAGGMGVGMHSGSGGFRGRVIRFFYMRDRRPVALNFAYLSAIFKRLGHDVEYALDRSAEGDIYLFNPALLTLEHEIRQAELIRARSPKAQLWWTGSVVFGLKDVLVERLSNLNGKILIGEPEMLMTEFDRVYHSQESVIDLGALQDLDQLPFPDWSPFGHNKFKIRYDFWRFPTAYIQQSRGCTFKCNYCPYIMIENKTRLRDPESVVAEIQHGIDAYGFRSFKFRDPLFGLDRKRVLRVAEGIAALSTKIQFSIETRIDLMRDETLLALKRAGLTSITVGIETPNEEMLRKYQRAPIKDDRQRDFILRCRELGIRTVAGFMVGFPEDTAENILWVLNYARKLNPTYANFNVVTPYPGTGFHQAVRDQIASHNFADYSVYQPVMRYKHLSADQVKELHAKCFTKFYFRSRYFRDNAALLWPRYRSLLQRLLPIHAPATDQVGSNRSPNLETNSQQALKQINPTACDSPRKVA
ncbi:MAG TPA: radical SAM protein [Pirellulaceae bacterium]|nr:radical SAM protein [Pirellulaceae bacterium]HMP70048.1 radical SAM protein [Pirellulaceae bacterium]